MIKIKKGNTLIFGLSDNNVDRLKDSQPISFNLKELGLDDINIFICHGKDEKTLAEMFGAGIGPETKVIDKSAAPVPFVPTAMSGEMETALKKLKMAVIKVPEFIEGADIQLNGVHPIVMLNFVNMAAKHFAKVILDMAEKAVGKNRLAQEQWIDRTTKKYLPDNNKPSNEDVNRWN